LPFSRAQREKGKPSAEKCKKNEIVTALCTYFF